MDWIAALIINGVAARQATAMSVETAAMSVMDQGTPFITAVATPTTETLTPEKTPVRMITPNIADPKLYQS